MRRALNTGWAKAAAFAALSTPAVWMAWQGYRDELGPNPIEAITRGTGIWTLRVLLISLAITPARKLLGLPELIRFRRLAGLFAFFYATLHLFTYLWLDKFFAWPEIWQDVVKRRFITAGMLAFALLVPLAATSTAGWIRRLGGRRWQALHRLVYISAIAGVVHYLWLVKAGVIKPGIYAAALGVLMAWRALDWFRRRRA
ncbi:MAG: sulfoxide reductase heme-binding subunit YedZ [Candidatus Solibacter sp.]|nr:sulfoxide reductase heme-binding subunit YedZ [Candidatus Solibacter sp.]